jgi:hypothetical protein
MKENSPRKLYKGAPTKDLPKPRPTVTNVNPNRGEYEVKDGTKKTTFYF